MPWLPQSRRRRQQSLDQAVADVAGVLQPPPASLDQLGADMRILRTHTAAQAGELGNIAGDVRRLADAVRQIVAALPHTPCPTCAKLGPNSTG